VTCHALEWGAQKDSLGVRLLECGPNRGPTKALIPQEGCRNVFGILRKLADRRKMGL